MRRALENRAMNQATGLNGDSTETMDSDLTSTGYNSCSDNYNNGEIQSDVDLQNEFDENYEELYWDESSNGSLTDDEDFSDNSSGSYSEYEQDDEGCSAMKLATYYYWKQPIYGNFGLDHNIENDEGCFKIQGTENSENGILKYKTCEQEENYCKSQNADMPHENDCESLQDNSKIHDDECDLHKTDVEASEEPRKIYGDDSKLLEYDSKPQKVDFDSHLVNDFGVSSSDDLESHEELLEPIDDSSKSHDNDLELPKDDQSFRNLCNKDFEDANAANILKKSTVENSPKEKSVPSKQAIETKRTEQNKPRKRHIGVIDKLHSSYGFIQCNSTKNRYYFKKSEVSAITNLRAGDMCEFEVVLDVHYGKPKAVIFERSNALETKLKQGFVVRLMKDYGFIACEDGSRDIHFHFQNIKGSSASTLQIGTEVQFYEVRSKKGQYYASHVKVITNQEVCVKKVDKECQVDQALEIEELNSQIQLAKLQHQDEIKALKDEYEEKLQVIQLEILQLQKDIKDLLQKQLHEDDHAQEEKNLPSKKVINDLQEQLEILAQKDFLRQQYIENQSLANQNVFRMMIDMHEQLHQLQIEHQNQMHQSYRLHQDQLHQQEYKLHQILTEQKGELHRTNQHVEELEKQLLEEDVKKLQDHELGYQNQFQQLQNQMQRLQRKYDELSRQSSPREAGHLPLRSNTPQNMLSREEPMIWIPVPDPYYTQLFSSPEGVGDRGVTDFVPNRNPNLPYMPSSASAFKANTPFQPPRF
eukprot:TRINITY_DN1928_c0_g1_i7.p1 TRINITY_DN1928_c0_g1~~TRINITY_DN1928_c0_g1_i7.p1  ORF type:complete len:757 (+),score=118.34 TRINITY_DN1928_c0_g1_i7:73-2343(+)